MKQDILTQIKKKNIKITEKSKQLITECVNTFVSWLSDQKLKKIDKTVVSFEFFEMDNTMKVGKNKDLHFNLEFLKTCTVDYFITIVLHEAYHYFINNIPNKRDAKRVKDFYYHQMMNHIDIEADLYVAKFFKENYSFSLENYLALYFSGASAFADEEIRPPKFERYVCSMLSIAHIFLHNEFAIYKLNIEAVRLLDKPRVILHKGFYSEAKIINLSSKNLSKLQHLYQFPTHYDEDLYVNSLIDVLFKGVDGHKKKTISTTINFNKRNFQSRGK
jgi:predicted SprT family Zn-dependent metalloprotease